MSTVIGFSGAQGTGKTTILRKLQQYFGLDVVSTESVSRLTQAQLGYSILVDAYKTPDDMCRFQSLLLDNMDQRLKEKDKGPLFICDRTPADVWAYTLLWMTRLGMVQRKSFGLDFSNRRYMDWAHSYRQRCEDYIADYSLVVVVPPNPAIPFQEEANRADYESQGVIQSNIEELLSKTKTRVLTMPAACVSVEDRSLYVLARVLLDTAGGQHMAPVSAGPSLVAAHH